MAEQQVDLAVFTPRLIKALTSGVVPQASTPVRVLIKFQSDEALGRFLEKQADIAATAAGASRQRFQIIRPLRSIRAVAVEIRLDALQKLSTLATEVGIQTIDEDFRVHGFLDETATLETINVARQLDLHGEGIRVAILDTGIDDTHPDLRDVVAEHINLTSEGREDLVGHGTHVASIVAGRGVVDQSKKGMADQATLISVKVLASDGTGSASTVIAGIEEAVGKGAQVINMSLGAAGQFDGTDPLSEAANWAVAQGVTVCAAAGNCGPQGNILQCGAVGDKTIGTPGCAADVITVGAVNKDQSIAGYSSRGPTWGNLVKPDLVTVGSQIVAARAKNTAMGTPVNDSYTRASGTSMATPVCTGLVALLLEQARKNAQPLTPKEVKDRLRAAAVRFGNVGDNVEGLGFLTAQGLFSAASTEPRPAKPKPSEPLPKEPARELLVVQSFAPEGNAPATAGAKQTWFLTLSNQHDARLYDVEIHVAPHPAVSVNPPDEAFGTLQPGGDEPVGLIVEADKAGDVTLDLVASYRMQPAGEVKQEKKTIGLRFAPKASTVATGPVGAVLDSAVRRLLARQNEDGTWAGAIMYNAWTNGMYCMLHRLLDFPGEPTQALKWLEEHRSGLGDNGAPDGTWGIVDDPSPHFLEGTVAAEIALEIWGRGRRQDVWDFIDRSATGRLASALSLLDPFTQAFAALASRYAPPGTPVYYSLQDILAPPPELLLLPRFLPASLPRLAGTWGQNALASLMVITTVGSGKPVSLAKEVLLKKAEAFLLRTQNTDGSWYDTILPTMATTLAMYMLGYDLNHPVMQRAAGFLQRLQRADGYFARYRLPVWDTSIAVLALREAGLSDDHPQLQRAGQYLVSCQRTIDGGIPFQRENAPWPDTDDTAFAILALHDIDMGDLERRKQVVIAEGLRWLLFMQGADGGWAAFAKDQAKAIKGRVPYFKDDPPTADVTGHVLSAMKLAPRFGEAESGTMAVDRARAWIQQYQLSGGEWFGRWGLTYTYGTSAVLQGFYDIGEDMAQDYLRGGVEYLLRTQQADGGWGEGFATYYNVLARDPVASTVDQTAWSLLGLMSVPATPRIRESVEKGVQFLLAKYDAQNGWPEDRYTVGALWIYKNNLYPLLWGIWALARYSRAQGG